MREETAGLLEGEGGEMRESYSGRGMYGRTTFGVVFDDQRTAIQAIAQAAFDAGQSAAEEEHEDSAHEVLDDLLGLQFDSMGLGIIVY